VVPAWHPLASGPGTAVVPGGAARAAGGTAAAG